MGVPIGRYAGRCEHILNVEARAKRRRRAALSVQLGVSSAACSRGKLAEESRYKHSTLIMQLLRDELAHWTFDQAVVSQAVASISKKAVVSQAVASRHCIALATQATS